PRPLPSFLHDALPISSANPTISATADRLFGGLSVALATTHPLAQIVNRRQAIAMEAITGDAMAAFFGGTVPPTFDELGLRSMLRSEEHTSELQSRFDL